LFGDSSKADVVTQTVIDSPRLVSLTNAMKWNVVFGGMDINKIKATAKLLDFDVSGDYHKIREHVAARSKRKYSEVPVTEYEPFECIVCDMIVMKQKSIDGALYAHNFKDKKTKLCWSYPVKDASTDTFLVVLKQLLARLHRYKVGILRTDAGSNYTANKVKTFLESRGIKFEECVIAAPHQIMLAERNHGILLPTVRALMSFSNAPYRLWANCIMWACVLHNISAHGYNTKTPSIPFFATKQTIDKKLLLPFGCLIIVHRDKAQVVDGKLDPRGLFGVFIGLADEYEFKKGIKVLLPNGEIIQTCFFTSDIAYFPWRLPGQRRLLSDGTFGKEIETSMIFPQEPPFEENLLFTKRDLDLDDSVDDVSPPTLYILEPSPSPQISTSPISAPTEITTGASTSSANAKANETFESRFLDKSLLPGDRIVFVFHPPYGRCYGEYLNKAYKRSDRERDLCRIRWDDGGKEMVQLSEARRFLGKDLNEIDEGQWAIVASRRETDDETSFLFAAHAQVENNIFTRDFHDIPDNTLLIPIHNLEDENHGPFTEAQVMKQTSWPEWKAAANKEIEQIAARDVFELVDEDWVRLQGHFIFPSRFVYTVSSKGVRKGRLVVRGDYQTFIDNDDLEYDSCEGEYCEYYENYDVESHSTSYGTNTDFVDKHLMTSEATTPTKRKLDGVPGTSVDSCGPKIDVPVPVVSSKTNNTGRKLFSPVVNRASQMILLTLAVVHKMAVFIADVKGAFLYADLFEDEFVFVRPPKGWENHPRFKGKIMKLKKALYGLRQAPRRWYTCLHEALQKSGLTRSLKDPCIMYLRDGDFKINVGTHVDDLLFTTSDTQRFENWFKTLKFTFGTASWLTKEVTKFVSLDFTYDMAKQYMRISQRRYITKALEMLGYDGADFKSISTPMEVGTKHYKADMPSEVNPELRALAQRNLGIAGWICQMTMPEALYAWSYLAQFASNPNAAVLKDVKRLFRYFKWTLEKNVEGLTFTPLQDLNVPHIGTVANNQIYGFVDSTHISEERSISRYGLCVFMSGMLILAISNKLCYVTLSSTESEYVGMSEALKRIMYLIEFLEELGEKQGSVPIGNDNSGAIAIAENKGMNAGRVRHIQARVHWIQDVIESSVIVLKKIPTKSMPADNLTKALGYEAHARHASYQKGCEFPNKNV